jgi:hypothetical protein
MDLFLITSLHLASVRVVLLCPQAMVFEPASMREYTCSTPLYFLCNLGTDHIENTAVLLLCACMLWPLPSNGHCLRSHDSATGLHATIFSYSDLLGLGFCRHHVHLSVSAMSQTSPRYVISLILLKRITIFGSISLHFFTFYTSWISLLSNNAAISRSINPVGLLTLLSPDNALAAVNIRPLAPSAPFVFNLHQSKMWNCTTSTDSYYSWFCGLLVFRTKRNVSNTGSVSILR